MNGDLMNYIPDWLPALVLLSEYGGNWERYLEAVYEYFKQDFVCSKPKFEGKQFSLKRHPLSNGKEWTFWHLIQEGEVEEDRLPDLRRCERIRWPKPIIEAIRTDKVWTWKNKRKQATRIVIAIKDFSYVVILEERRDYVLLWTAYWVERPHRRKKLRNEYEQYQKS